jgi:ABC-type polysaccharide/polyol phosphate export permease
LTENFLASYRQNMTVRDEVSIAGVAWPLYKLLALVIGFLVLLIVAVATGSAAPSVLAAAAAGTLVWLTLGAAARR